MKGMDREVRDLEAGAVHVYLVSGDGPLDPESRTQVWSWMDPTERARHDRFRVERARHQHLRARALVRLVLCRYAAVDPGDWSFRIQDHGRPEVEGPAGVPPLRFDLSHTRGLVACAVTVT